ncbi:MAG: maltose alpha-D-glucosyltransferase [Saprospiraceae bacterium]
MSLAPALQPSLWYKDAIIYQVHIKSFCDSNNDGYGDIKGLISKLDYIQSLGVTAIWVMPFFESPLQDDGYDIADYYKVNPNYGDIDDVRELVSQAHARGLKIIMEMVINHTSDQHPWFQRAIKAPVGSSERNFYVWSDDNKQYDGVRIIFLDTEESNWTWQPEVEQYYWHRFFHHQPDLNFENPAVEKAIYEVIDFWASMGVDGFRLDAIPYLFEEEGTTCENLAPTHAFLKRLRKHVDQKFNGEICLLAEANMMPADSAAYFGDGDECHMNYHFPLMPRLYMGMAKEDRTSIVEVLERTPDIPENCQWATFLRNHDELTLEMVTPEERQWMWNHYCYVPEAKQNMGIRLRLARLMEGSYRKQHLMNTMLFTMPGTPVIYYGDEIGMGDNVYLNDRDGVRTPMQWTPETNAGFSHANPQQLYLPVISDPEFHYETVNVQVQENRSRSMLHWMRRMISIRKRYLCFGRGEMIMLAPEDKSILAYIRKYEDEVVLVVCNLSGRPTSVNLELNEYKGCKTREILGGADFHDIGDNYRLTITGWGTYLIEISK